MRRLVLGASPEDIALESGLHVGTVRTVINTSIFKAELAKLEAEISRDVIVRAQDLSLEALDTLGQLMRSARQETVRKSSADSILDRAGYAKVERKELLLVKGEDVIKELNRQRREQAAVDNGDSAKDVSGEHRAECGGDSERAGDGGDERTDSTESSTESANSITTRLPVPASSSNS
jgi:G3E family GTPase